MKKLTMELAIIPKPVKITFSPDNSFVMDCDTVSISNDLEIKEQANYLAKFLKIPLSSTGKEEKQIYLRIVPKMKEGGYRLIIEKSKIEITATSSEGIFYGIQTLRQICPKSVEKQEEKSASVFEIPCVDIIDYPRFTWRGFHVDVARHFLPKEDIFKIIDFMALQKLNILHLHLTDDQGWRVEIKQYPKLMTISSKRRGTSIGPNDKDRKEIDNIPHEGFYTQDELKEIVKHAASQFITIVPEIEFPGHSQAVLAAYPELGCTGEKFEVACKWGHRENVFCGGNPKVMEFFKGVLDEVVAIFPSKYIHIGGDEVPKDHWKNCPKCQHAIEDNKDIDNEKDLQYAITMEMVDHLERKGRKTVVWNDELSPKKTDTRAVWQYWTQNLSKVAKYAEKGGKLILSPASRYYLNIKYIRNPLNLTYKWKMERYVSKKARKNVLGLEAELWGEVITDIRKLEWNAFPRLLAIAESAWTPKKEKNWRSFKNRVEKLLQRLDLIGINHAEKNEYCPSPFDQIFRKGNSGQYE